MAATDRKPILFTDCLVDVTYMCEWCGTQTKRAVREPVRPARSGGLVAAPPLPAGNREAEGYPARRARQRPCEYGSSSCPDAKPFG
jgi:hypothetical protein